MNYTQHAHLSGKAGSVWELNRGQRNVMELTKNQLNFGGKIISGKVFIANLMFVAAPECFVDCCRPLFNACFKDLLLINLF